LHRCAAPAQSASTGAVTHPRRCIICADTCTHNADRPLPLHLLAGTLPPCCRSLQPQMLLTRASQAGCGYPREPQRSKSLLLGHL